MGSCLPGGGGSGRRGRQPLLLPRESLHQVARHNSYCNEHLWGQARFGPGPVLLHATPPLTWPGVHTGTKQQRAGASPLLRFIVPSRSQRLAFLRQPCEQRPPTEVLASPELHEAEVRKEVAGCEAPTLTLTSDTTLDQPCHIPKSVRFLICPSSQIAATFQDFFWYLNKIVYGKHPACPTNCS